jgi:tetratricopeptide (TPR) repeat protein
MEAEQATTLLRSLDDKWTLAIALAFHTGGKITTGKFNEAIASIDEALRLAEELGDRYVLGSVMTAASFVEFFVNRDFAKAYTFREKASELLREHGSRYSYGLTVLGFGELLVQQGQFQKAREELNSAMQTMQEIGSTRHIVNIKSVLAHVMRREGNYLEAIPAYHETIKEWQRMGHRSAVAHQLECLAFIAKSLEQVEKATKLLGAAEALRQKIESDMTLPERKEYEKEVADIKANMDGKEFASLWAEGRSMTMEQAIQFALAPE